MRKFQFTDDEMYLASRMTGMKKKLLIDLESFQQAVSLASFNIRAIDRCQDAWIAEVLFRRNIPISNCCAVDIGEDGFEVNDDQPT